MKKIYVINACVLIIIFLTAGIVANPKSESENIETLISKRIEVLNNFYRSKATFDQAKDSLEKIESGSLLKLDVKEMKRNQATDMDMVKDYKIVINSIETNSFGIVKGYAEVAWIMETYNGIEKLDGEYFFTGEINKKKLKLTQLKKI